MVSVQETFGPHGPHILDLLHAASLLVAPDESIFQAPLDDDPDSDGALQRVDEILLALPSPRRGLQVDAARNAVQGAAAYPTLERPEFQLQAGVAAFRAATGLAARDLIDPDTYSQLTLEWRTKVGGIHPNDDIRA